MHTLTNFEYGLAVLSVSVVMFLCIWGCLYIGYHTYRYYYIRKLTEERRLLLIESKLRRLGSRIHIHNWEQLDD